MALNIKSAEADALARDLARRRNKGITEVVIEALRHELEREKGRVYGRGMAAKLDAIGKRYAALEQHDGRTDEEILGYDEMVRRG